MISNIRNRGRNRANGAAKSWWKSKPMWLKAIILIIAIPVSVIAVLFIIKLVIKMIKKFRAKKTANVSVEVAAATSKELAPSKAQA